ncbi:hypothetical protein ACFRDV_14605 [Streptomyces fagopyri]|uniref:hypothetical protein n=1 Tax=Streptomyces fagopyri TaxID=2662397 RepID=UPI003689F3D9
MTASPEEVTGTLAAGTSGAGQEGKSFLGRGRRKDYEGGAEQVDEGGAVFGPHLPGSPVRIGITAQKAWVIHRHQQGCLRDVRSAELGVGQEMAADHPVICRGVDRHGTAGCEHPLFQGAERCRGCHITPMGAVEVMAWWSCDVTCDETLT